MTIGYEGLDLDRFFRMLRWAQVDIIIDVRQNPLSRKKGFSKTALATAACENGFQYIHLREFGCPKDVRDDYRADGDWSRYTERYLAHLETLDSPLTLLTRQVLSKRCCLLCFEADPATCHRSFVAERVTEIADDPLAVVHLRATNQAINQMPSV